MPAPSAPPAPRDPPAAAPPAPAPRWALVRLTRPRQWIKNALVLAPVVFADLARDGDAVGKAVVAALLFTLASAAVYVLNDLADVEGDRLHPRKRHARPVAAGWVSVRAARNLGLALAACVLAGMLLRPALAPVLAVFAVLNVAYSLGLKRVPVVDVLCVAAGYLLRVYGGAVAVDVPLSGWMAATTLSLSVFLVAGKRAVELAGSGAAGRAVLGGYAARPLALTAQMAAVASLVCYAAYVLLVRPALLVTIPLVAFGLARYGWLVYARGLGESPEDALWDDRPLLATVVLWAVACVVLVG
ncbi:MAG TPA: decaprenyl-phosphate phosphoribosyltransferase [Longimicrobium sp.]